MFANFRLFQRVRPQAVRVRVCREEKKLCTGDGERRGGEGR